jgi:hypothetical protein
MRKIVKYIMSACVIYLTLKWVAENPHAMKSVREFVKNAVKKITDEVLEVL